MTKFLIGIMLGLTTSIAVAQINIEEEKPIIDTKPIQIIKTSEDKAREFVATTTLDVTLEEAFKIVQEEKQNSEITKRLDKIIQIMERNEK
jgi:CRP-like cAMP-binding protein